MNDTKLPQFLKDMIACPPKAGDGVHKWPFKVARQLIPHRKKDDIFSLIRVALEDCGRDVPDREIREAINAAEKCPWTPRSEGGTSAHTSKWPDLQLEAIDAIVREGSGVYDIVERSPIRFDPESHTEEIIDVVFPGDPLLCCAKKAEIFATRRREKWRGRLSQLPLIVPNPMLRVEGLTQYGTPSEHTKAATGRKVYQVIEFDFSEKCRDGKKDSKFAPLVRAWRKDGIDIADACASLILLLAAKLPKLVVVCHSGGKSVHAWFRVFEMSQAEQRSFMEYAVSMGADDATWCKSQFVRIPDGLRDNGVRQTAYYLDPEEAV